MLVMMCSMSVHRPIYLSAVFTVQTSQQRQNNVFKEYSLTPSFEENFLTQRHEISSQKL